MGIDLPLMGIELPRIILNVDWYAAKTAKPYTSRRAVAAIQLNRNCVYRITSVVKSLANDSVAGHTPQG